MSIDSIKQIKIFLKFYRVKKILIPNISCTVICFRVTLKIKIEFDKN